MNCCSHSDHDNHHKKGHLSHIWMMALCCGAPLLALLLLPLLGSRFPAVGAFLLSAVPFLCPILMIGMIPLMLIKGKREKKEEQKPGPVESEEKDRPRYLE